MFSFKKRAAVDVPTPAADKVTVFIDTTGAVKTKDEAGTVDDIAGGGGSYIPLPAEAPTAGQILSASVADPLATDWIAAPSGTTAWTAHTPTITGSGGSNPSVGAGTATGRYVHEGYTVRGWMAFVGGAGASAGTGDYRFNLPVAPRNDAVIRAAGSALTYVSTITTHTAAIAASASYAVLYISGTTNKFNAGHGFGNGSEIYIQYQYEAAAAA